MHIRVRVTPDSRAEKVIKKSDDAYVISVRETAERGEANERVLEILRKLFPKKSVRLVSGHHTSAKIVDVH